MRRSSSGDKSPAPGISRSITNFGMTVLQWNCAQARQIYKPQPGVAAQVLSSGYESSNQKGRLIGAWDRRWRQGWLAEGEKSFSGPPLDY